MKNNIPLLKELRRRIKRFGYAINTEVIDGMGRVWKYSTTPNHRHGGPTNYFKDKKSLCNYVKRVEFVEKRD